MSTSSKKSHSGFTKSGNVRDVRIQRIGRVTVYKRGKNYYLYYREKGKSVRRKVEGNLAVARALASKTAAALEEGRHSPLGFQRVPIADLVDCYVDYCASVKNLAYRTVDRYRAALGHLKEFAAEQPASLSADQVTQGTVEDFVRWLRKQSRTRNGAEGGRRRPYSPAGIKFILSTCRTAFNWASKRPHLPPYSENPFSGFPIESMAKRESGDVRILSPEEQRAFFEACDSWQKSVFLTLSLCGLRVGELTHLLISDVDLEREVLHVRSKPEMCWHVKTRNKRTLPVVPELGGIFRRCIGDRKAGFLFLNKEFADGRKEPSERFSSRRALFDRVRELTEQAREQGAEEEKEMLRALRPFLRAMGQIPEKRIRQEFMKITRGIGAPELTRAHSLRHLFSTRAQENGMNPLLVQGLLGHASLDMTQLYTHFGMDAKREAVSRMLDAAPLLREAAEELAL